MNSLNVAHRIDGTGVVQLARPCLMRLPAQFRLTDKQAIGLDTTLGGWVKSRAKIGDRGWDRVLQLIENAEAMP